MTATSPAVLEPAARASIDQAMSFLRAGLGAAAG